MSVDRCYWRLLFWHSLRIVCCHGNERHAEKNVCFARTYVVLVFSLFLIFPLLVGRSLINLPSCRSFSSLRTNLSVLSRLLAGWCVVGSTTTSSFSSIFNYTSSFFLVSSLSILFPLLNQSDYVPGGSSLDRGTVARLRPDSWATDDDDGKKVAP